MNLYEVDYNYTLSDLNVTREMNIEKETEKMYYGTFISLRTSYKDKFSLRKSKVNSVGENMYGNKFFQLQTYIFAENSTEALIKASKMFHSHLINEASKITEYLPTSCKICGAEVIFEDNGGFFASSDYIGTDMCRNCMEEHCSTTDCRNCKLGSLPNCKYQFCKTVVLDKSELLECDEKTGRIKVDKKIYNDCFVPNSYILIRFGGTDIKKQYMLIFEDNEAIYMKDTDNQFSTCNC